jgi:pimeloyl-ACP methyl ester carboxylesterase
MLAGTDLGAVLVDLRQHGRSQGFAGPQTIDAAAADLETVAAEFPLSGVVGHSFGGKVALAYLARTPRLERAYILDSTPGTRPDARGSEGTMHIIELLSALPPSFPTRDAFSAHLLAAGLERPITEWLAMNVVRVDDGPAVRFGLNMTDIRALIDDYLVRDLWTVVENPPGKTRVTMIAGGRSNVLSDADLDRVRAAETARPDRVRLRVLPSAGHWVHVDDPEGLVAALREP